MLASITITKFLSDGVSDDGPLQMLAYHCFLYPLQDKGYVYNTKSIPIFGVITE